VALVLLGARGAARLLARVPVRARPVAGAALALLVLFDLRMDPRLETFPAGIPSIYAGVHPGMRLIELPENAQITYMYFSTFHWATLIGGYSGFPRFSEPAMDGWHTWPEPSSLDAFRRAGATHLTYNCALEQYPWRCARVFALLDAAPGLELTASGLWQGKEARLYRFK
jgi:hypothetical protein